MECSVVLVFLLLLFFINVSGFFETTVSSSFVLVYVCVILFYLNLIDVYQEQDTSLQINIYQNNLTDNFYEILFNFLLNDLYGFSISYYTVNFVEYIVVGFLLLLGSVVCVNLNQIGKSMSGQNYCEFITKFKFFTDFVPFMFLRRQNLINQSNKKSFVKIYTKA